MKQLNIRQIASTFVADLSPSTDCAFNVAKKGLHRFCSRMGRKEIGGYLFCHRHAETVSSAILKEVRTADEDEKRLQTL